MKILLWIAFCLLAVNLWAGDTCDATLFKGFDSRLQVEVIGALPNEPLRMVGFEIAEKSAVVAYPHRILAYSKERVAGAPSLDVIRGICLDSTLKLHVVTSKGLRQIGPDHLIDDQVTLPQDAFIASSGRETFLIARQDQQHTELLLSGFRGGTLKLAKIPGTLQAASWSSLGMTAAIGGRLLAWDGQGTQLISLSSNLASERIQDLCLVGKERVVIALTHAVFLITPDSRTVIAGMNARCRWSDGVLYLADQDRRIIWSVRGLEKMGTRKLDVDHARSLVLSLGSAEAASQFLEASRIVGCRQARVLRGVH